MNPELETADSAAELVEEVRRPISDKERSGAVRHLLAGLGKRQHMIAWGGVLARFFAVQLLVQVGTGFAGIAIIRLLTKPEFAWYSVATSLMFAATALSDCGVGVALTALGGKVWQDGEALGSLISSALSIRRWFVAIVVAGIGIVVPLLLHRDHAPLLQSLSVAGTVILSILVQFSISLYGVVPRLRANYSLLQNSTMASIGVRLCLIGILYLCYANATTAMLANAAGFGIQLWLYRRFAAEQVNLHASIRKDMVSEILGIVRKQVPYELYGAISGQLSILLISLFGNSGRVAEVGALGRLAMILTATSGVVTNVLVPRFARCQDPKRLLSLFWKILLLYSCVLSAVLLACGVFPHQVVSVLGQNYANMGGECFLAVTGAVVGALMTAVWSLNISRGWIVPAWIGIGLGIAAQAFGIALFDIRTVHGILLMTLLLNSVGVVLHLIASAYFFRANGFDAVVSTE
jgi:hypothetical protein